MLFAEGYLAAISFARLVFLTIIIAFASIAVWSGLLMIAATALSSAGLSQVLIIALFTILHIGVLLISALAVQGCTKGMQFESSRRLLRRSQGSNSSSSPTPSTPPDAR